MEHSREISNDLVKEVIKIRRYLHKYPEISEKEFMISGLTARRFKTRNKVIWFYHSRRTDYSLRAAWRVYPGFSSNQDG